MERTITIKGVGKATVKPDYVIISLTIEAKEKKYADSVQAANTKIKNLNATLESAGLEKESAKTVSYNVREDYQYIQDRKGQRQRQHTGYVCVHRLKIEFDYNTERLSKVLGMISRSFANPQLDVSFTIKDRETVEVELLRAAAVNAKRKAEALCTASGAGLGKLLTVNYNWREINIFTKPDFYVGNTEQLLDLTTCSSLADIQPDDIDISDSAEFVWEIE